MPLEIFLLGQFKLQADGVHFELPSRPAQSLLAYLALNAGITQRRETLASLLWPEASESNARSYLRQALWRIRKALGEAGLDWEDFLQISDIDVTFEEQSNHWLDATELLRHPGDQPLEALVETARLYRGELLPGFYEEWVVLQRDRLCSAYHQCMDSLLDRLLEDGRWREALDWGENWIRLDYAPESAFRALMRAHTGLGDKAMVTAVYRRCVEALQRDLGMAPSPETEELYQSILKRERRSSTIPAIQTTFLHGDQPSFLGTSKVSATEIEVPLFVARDPELAQLECYLDQALSGHGRVVFITGEAGSGKTATVDTFARRAQAAHPELLFAGGGCNAYTGLGDPYLPFREILNLLTGDVESRWAAGTISQEHARRLWAAIPLTVQALMDYGADLVDTFIPGLSLLERASLTSPGVGWLKRLEELKGRKEAGAVAATPQQKDLFEQYTRVLTTLARQAPLLLALDDLHWADLGSISLLLHLGRRLAGSRILVLGAYRPEEVALGREGARHPLETALHELQRKSGELAVDLDRSEHQTFINIFLDSEPNRLDEPFREMLYRHTSGHPLYTLELLRGMQERGDLLLDEDGYWIEGQALNWETLPVRVEAVVAERIDRLDRSLRDALKAASVEGEVFTAEVVARIQGSNERQMVKRLSSELDRKHRLVRAHAIDRLGSRRVSRYRFRHILVQKYLYDTMDELERAYLHEDVGNILEEIYADQADEIAVQLARHFQVARVPEKAIHYLHQAGHKAVQLTAYQEAIAHLDAGLTMLMASPDTSERAQRELDYQLCLAMAQAGAKGIVPEVKQAYFRARELCQQLGNNEQLVQVLGGLSSYYYVIAEYGKARQFAEESLELAQKIDDTSLTAMGHWYLGFILFCLGAYRTALDHLEQVNAFYEPAQHHHQFVALRGSDIGPSALAYTACCLWCLGYPDQAEKFSLDAIGLARKFGHPFTLVDTLCYAGCLFNEMRKDEKAMMGYAAELKQLSDEMLHGWLMYATRYFGEALALLGQFEDGIKYMLDGSDIGETGEQAYRSGTFCLLAEAQSKLGMVEEGLITLEEALHLVEQTGERYCAAELHRMRGELLLITGDEVQAEASFQDALRIARQQEARSWEMRAAMSQAKQWMNQGKLEQALELLKEIYGWFNEGFDTPDLKEAKALLDELTQTYTNQVDVNL